MAGKLRLAAKMVLATATVSTGGASVYYASTAGWPMLQSRLPLGVSIASDADVLKSESDAFAAGDLDAVASAWAEPKKSDHNLPADSSTIARSADLALAHLEAPQYEDRYNLAVHNEEAAAAEPSVAVTPAEHPPAEDITPAEETASAPRSEDAEPDAPEPTEAELHNSDNVAEKNVPTPALARGQEPKDNIGRNETAEPEPLNVSGQVSNIGAANERAQNAFASEASMAAGNRYASAGAEQREPAIANPFNSQQGSEPASATKQKIDALPALADEAPNELAELQQSAPIDSFEDSGRTARASVGSALPEADYDSPLSSRTDSLLGAPPAAPATMPAASDNTGRRAAANEGTGRPGERALEGAQRPALEIQKFAPTEIQVGKPAKFVVQVRNVGAQAADDIKIRDEVPDGTRLISTTPNAEIEGGHLVWQLGKLSPGEDRSVEMQLMPMAEGEVGSVATIHYSAQASVKTHCTMPQLAIRMTAPEKVMVGQEQRVKIELRNPGSGDATGVMLFENVPKNVRHAAGPALEFEIGTLRAGETRELELVLVAEKAGHTVNVLTARGDGNLQVQQQVEFEVIAPALTVGIDGPERRYLERPATYEVSVENPGTAPAHNVQIITKLPKGMRFVRANNMGEYDAASHAVYWSLAELPEGEKGTVEVVAMPTEAGSQTLEVESRAGQGLSDETKQDIVVDGLAAIMFEVRDLEDPIEVGRETGYEIRVVNQGTKAASNVQIAVALPPGMKFVSAEGETQHVAKRGGVLFDAIPQLAPKADTVYRLRVQGAQAGDQRVTVEVNTDDLSQPIRREESTRVFGDE